jgi:hypothetical protein
MQARLRVKASMAASKSGTALHATTADTTAAVDAFMATLDHPHKDSIETLRRIILGSDRCVSEGIKWKAPSFRAGEYFATVNLRARVGIEVILHLGAKVRETAVTGVPIADPDNLLKWLARDRAVVGFADARDLAAREIAFQEILRQWIALL